MHGVDLVICGVTALNTIPDAAKNSSICDAPIRYVILTLSVILVLSVGWVLFSNISIYLFQYHFTSFSVYKM